MTLTKDGTIIRSGRAVRRPWSKADDDLLRTLILTGKHARAVAVQMDRSPESIRSRARALKISLKKVATGLKAKR